MPLSWSLRRLVSQALTRFRARKLPSRTPRRPRMGVEGLENRLVPTLTPGSDVLFHAYQPTDAFALHSNPGSDKVIFLDFDGHTVTATQWNTDTNGGADF